MAGKLIAELARNGIHIRLVGEDLEVSIPRGKKLPDLLSQLKARKSEVVAYMKERASTDKPEEIEISMSEEQDHYGLTTSQERLWILCQLPDANKAYNLVNSYLIEVKVNIENLQKCIDFLVEKYEILRSNFLTIDGAPRQKYIQEKIAIQFEDISIFQDPLKEANQRIRLLVNSEMDLENDALFKTVLLKIDVGRYIFLMKAHHIISDGLSNDILTKNIFEGYKTLQNNEILVQNENIQFKDYIAWNNLKNKNGHFKKHKIFWSNKFKDNCPVLNFPTFKARPKIKTYNGGNFIYKMKSSTATQMHALSKEYHCTFHMLSLAFSGIMLNKYTGENDFVIGSPLSTRSQPQLEDQVGFFVNTLGLRFNILPTNEFGQLINHVKLSVLEAEEHKDYPMDQIINDIHWIHDPSRSPLFDIMISSEVSEKRPENKGDVSLRPYKAESTTSKYDFVLTFVDNFDNVELKVSYNSDIYKKEFLYGFCQNLENLVKEVYFNRQKQIKDLQYLSELEKEKLLVDKNLTQNHFPKGKTIIEIFEKQVNINPHKIAVVSNDINLSYKNLNEKANQFGRYLNSVCTANSKRLVAIHMSRTEKALIAIMGILKAGASYLALDYNSPADRLQYILKDSQVDILVYDDQSCLKDEDISKVSKVHFDLFTLLGFSGNNLGIIQNQCAYVMYTSGSTGRPKGVMVGHENVITLVKNTNYTKINTRDQILHLSNITFDGSVFEIFGAFLNGATLHTITETTILEIDSLCNYIISSNVNIGFMTTVMFNNLVEINPDVISCFDKLYFGGERATERYVQKACKYQKKHDSICHVYGPTEATTFSTYYPVEAHDFDQMTLPIGLPVSNTKIYVLDEFLSPVPNGVVGEIYIGGSGVAYGYLNRPELTEERFIKDPFGKKGKLYKTGDRGQWNEHGQLLFHGRVDKQLKINGFRIEPGEIEYALLKHEAVNQTVILTSDSKNNLKLIAFYTGTETDNLREYMLSLLPAYMIPNDFVWVNEMPLTKNGKVDSNQLFEFATKGNKSRIVLPRNQHEQILLSIWSKILGRENIGINQNFFQLGGDSIKAIQISARLKEKGYKLEVKDIYNNPSVESAAESMKPMEISKGKQKRISGELLLSPIQSDFFNWKFEEPHHFNQSFMISFNEDYSKDIIKECFGKIINHHDMLRAYFVNKNDSWYQYIQETVTIDVSEYICTGSENFRGQIKNHAQILQTKIELDKPPLLKVAKYKTQNKIYLLIIIHHLIIDTVSWRIIFEDLYKLLKNPNEETKLPAKSTSFKSWIQNLKAFANNEKDIKKDIEYWLGRNIEELSRLPTDFEVKLSDFDSLKHIDFGLSEKHTELLLTKANEPFNTRINDFLLTALGLALEEVFGMNKILVSMESHGREHIYNDLDLTRTVGWFTCTYPFLIHIDANENLEGNLISMKENRKKLPNNGIGYGALKYFSGMFNQQFNKFQPEICFNYLGQFDQDIKQNELEFSNELAGDARSKLTKRIYKLEISGKVLNHVLMLSIDYDTKQYREESIIQLQRSYKSNLINLIELCMAKKARLLTPSDTGVDEITQETLNKLNSMFE